MAWKNDFPAVAPFFRDKTNFSEVYYREPLLILNSRNFLTFSKMDSVYSFIYSQHSQNFLRVPKWTRSVVHFRLNTVLFSAKAFIWFWHSLWLLISNLLNFIYITLNWEKTKKYSDIFRPDLSKIRWHKWTNQFPETIIQIQILFRLEIFSVIKQSYGHLMFLIFQLFDYLRILYIN